LEEYHLLQIVIKYKIETYRKKETHLFLLCLPARGNALPVNCLKNTRPYMGLFKNVQMQGAQKSNREAYSFIR
jgi:hypothetical protein